jgi:type IV secretion system protein TrbL
MQANVATEIYQQFEHMAPQWFGAIWPYAARLFWTLAGIEMSWTMAVLAMEKRDIQSYMAAVVRRVMWIGAFAAILKFGPQWMPSIIESFQMLGQLASGVPNLNPGNVLNRGMNLASELLVAADKTSLFTAAGAVMVLVLCAVIVFMCFLFICVQLLLTQVEALILLSAGIIFLGMGGSRWTAPYVERYVSIAISIGTKLMLLFLMVGVGMNLSAQWIFWAKDVGKNVGSIISAWSVLGGAVIFAVMIWRIPAFFSSLLSGTSGFNVGDVMSTSVNMVTGAIAAASMATSAAKTITGSTVGALTGSAAVGTGGSGSNGAGGSGNGSAGSGGSVTSGPTGGNAVPPPPAPVHSGTLNGNSFSVPPPDAAASLNNAQESMGAAASGNEGIGSSSAPSSPPRAAPVSTAPKPNRFSHSGSGFRQSLNDIARALPSDGTPGPAPPHMPLGGGD